MSRPQRKNKLAKHSDDEGGKERCLSRGDTPSLRSDDSIERRRSRSIGKDVTNGPFRLMASAAEYYAEKAIEGDSDAAQRLMEHHEATDARKKRIVRDPVNPPRPITPIGKVAIKAKIANKAKRGQAGRCVKCEKLVPDLISHVYDRHQYQLTDREVHSMGLQVCACRRIVIDLRRHKCDRIRSMPTTAANSKKMEAILLDSDSEGSSVIDVNDDNIDVILNGDDSCKEVTNNTISGEDATPAENMDEECSEFQKFLNILANDNSLVEEIIFGYNHLASMPFLSKCFSPAESKMMNEKVSVLCNEYLKNPNGINLLRIQAIQKICLSPWATGNKLSTAGKLLKQYPRIEDKPGLEKKLKKWYSTPRSSNMELDKRVLSMLSKGRIGAAGKIISNPRSTIAEMDDNVREKLEQLHPDEPEPHVSGGGKGIEVRQNEIRRSLRECRTDAGAGPSGLDGNFISCLKYNEDFFSFLVYVSRKLADGELEPRELLLGSRLLPFYKDDDRNIRPIACGEIIYRICGRAILRGTDVKLETFQLGVSTPGGCEPMIELGRIKGPTKSIIAIDLKNAFNKLKRAFMLSAAKEKAPQLWKMIKWSYEHHSNLYLPDGSIMKSRSGVKQGDPLSPLLFSIGYGVILKELLQSLVHNGFQEALMLMAYLDDAFLSVKKGYEDKALKIIKDVFIRFHEESGLELRPEKTTITTPDIFSKTGMKMLGSHIGAGQEEFLKKFIMVFDEEADRLRTIRRQDAMIIMRKSMIPKLNHLLRSLEVDNKCWNDIDQTIVQFVLEMTNQIVPEDPAKFRYEIITLPVRMGGLGLTLPSWISDICREASKYSATSYLLSIEPILGVMRPGTSDKTQKERCREQWEEVREKAVVDLDDYSRVRFLDCASEMGSKWLHALPMNSDKTMRDKFFCSAVADRLLLTDVSGKYSSEMIYRHEEIKRCIKAAFQDCGCKVVLEPYDVSGPSRRADLLVQGNLVDGKKALDVSIILIQGAAAAKAAVENNNAPKDEIKKVREELKMKVDERCKKKFKENKNQQYGGSFCPVVISAHGTQHKLTENLFNKIRECDVKVSDEMLWRISMVLVNYRADIGLKAAMKK